MINSAQYLLLAIASSGSLKMGIIIQGIYVGLNCNFFPLKEIPEENNS